MIAADSLGVPYETLVGHHYKTSTWRETYAGVISSEGEPRDVDIPEDVKKMVLMPPVTKRQPGRRRKNRIPSIGEYPVRLLFVDSHKLWSTSEPFINTCACVR